MLSHEVKVGEWMDANILQNIYSDLGDSFALQSFALLDDHRVLLLITEWYTTPDLVVIDFCDRHPVPSARTKATAVLNDLHNFASLVLGLPYLSEDAIKDSITLECNPSPRRMVEGELFKQNNTPPVILVAYRSSLDYDPEHTFDLLIPARVITSRIKEQHPTSRKILLWQEWCTECRQVDGPEREALYPLSRVCGSRYITVHKSDDESASPAQEICIYDFDSIPALRRDIAMGDALVVVEPRVVDSPYEQGEPRVKLSTGAPYQEVRTGVFVGDDAELLIAEDGFVVRTPGDREDYAKYVLLHGIVVSR